MREISYTAKENDAGRQLKRIIRGEMGLSQHLYASLKRRGAVLIDGQPAHANAYLAPGQVITLRIDDAPAQDPENALLTPPPDLTVAIVYEDDDLMIVDKSAPLSCMRGLRGDGDSLEDRLIWLRRGTDFVFRPVNRLDKGTSGLMALAKHAHAQQLMQRALHTDQFVREYLAVVEGQVPDDQGTIDAPIGKADGATVRREVRSDGKTAVTHYRVLSRAGGLTLVRVRLQTGRTHQIRVHMAHIGHPIAGDFLYGREDPRLPGRFALHSCALSLRQPVTGEALAFESGMPGEMAALMAPPENREQ